MRRNLFYFHNLREYLLPDSREMDGTDNGDRPTVELFVKVRLLEVETSVVHSVTQ